MLPLLSVRGVKSYYGNIAALRGVDIEVGEGEIVALIGANGAGKSTLMMTIFGNPRAREGSISLCRARHHAAATHEIAALSIAQAPEGRRIFVRMTVMENLQIGAALAPPGSFQRRPGASLCACFRGSRSGSISAAARCRAASSRCWRSRAR